MGCVRKNNEDNFHADQERGLFIVCDGMGGHAAGEVASGLAVQTIAKELEKVDALRERFAQTENAEDAGELMHAVEEAVMNAGRAIFEDAQTNPEHAGMGTTCSLVLLAGKKGILAHVGDSRVYVVRKKALYQLSEDHTFVGEQLRRGLMTKEEAAKSKRGNVLTRALGPTESIQVDLMLFDVDARDRFLLCSDGLHNYFKDSTELLRSLISVPVEECVDKLIEKAKERGGHDNITTILVDAEDASETDTTQTAAGRIAVLKKVPLFAHMTYQELVKVISVMQTQQGAQGDILINEGARDDRLYVNLSGDLVVSKNGQAIATLPSGSHFGEMALIDNGARSATVICKTACNLLVMDRPTFYDLIRKEPSLGTKMLWAFTQAMSKRLRETNEHLAAAREELDEKGVTQEQTTIPPFDPGEETVDITDDEDKS
jgi:serine/threonine protein phosphatase PrpC/CRP-like cAMP-binding protein